MAENVNIIYTYIYMDNMIRNSPSRESPVKAYIFYNI